MLGTLLCTNVLEPIISGTEPRGRQWSTEVRQALGQTPTNTYEEYGRHQARHVSLRCLIGTS